MKFNIYSKFWHNSVYLSCLMLFVLVMIKQTLFPELPILMLLCINITFIILVIWAVLCVIVCSLPIILNKPSKEYEPNGDLEHWYTERLTLLGTNWCFSFIDNLSDLLSLPKFSFLSPSANKGVYEKAMFFHISQTHTVQFYISDLACLESHELPVGGNSFFEYFPQTDAKDIFHLIDLPINVIFDMKGVLWHSHLKQRKHFLKLYHESLADKGLLVVDCTNANFFSCVVAQYRYKLALLFKTKLPTRIEQSSEQKLKLSQKSLSKYFEPFAEINVDTNKGCLSFAIYRKK